ncbi:MAG: hypothetical protein H6755_06375 [Candidatus Omnitrophica bacterium]|nr:hypothetical protein [Candidatus Omnitrophota bacterium]MCB9748014.1 hypothetical protein [Candidatus Omnitrophota bacterium]
MGLDFIVTKDLKPRQGFEDRIFTFTDDEEGYYYGTGFGDDALSYYAMKWAETGNPLWAIPGGFAALWTPQTYQSTGWTLVSGGQYASQLSKTTYWQYYPKGVKNYPSKYFTSSKTGKPPYSLGTKAQQKLSLPGYNRATAVKEVKVNPFQYIKGPSKVAPEFGQPGGGTQYLFP